MLVCCKNGRVEIAIKILLINSLQNTNVCRKCLALNQKMWYNVVGFEMIKSDKIAIKSD